MKNLLSKSIQSLVYFFLGLIFPFSIQAQNTVIKAGHLFDSRTGKFIDNQVIIIKNNTIAQVGPNLAPGKNDVVIDLSQSWVLPGLMDCHVHITSNYPYRKFTGMEGVYITESSAFRALRGAYNAELLLKSGFTTIKDIGNDANYATADVIKAIRQGWVKGPTIFYSGKIIAPYGGQTNGINPENEKMWQFEYLDADTDDEIIKAIRKNIYYGANCIKIVQGDQPYYYTEKNIRTAADEAHRAGLKLTCHVFNGPPARNVILGGADAIEHGLFLHDSLLQMMKDRGTFLVGTDLTFDNFYAYGIDSGSAKSITDRIIDRLARAYKIGVKMAFGTDIIIDLPGKNRVGSNLDILKSWKAAKIPASYVLQTMTIYAAELLGVEKSLGVLQQNYRADIIALKNDPSKDIDAIKDVHFVMKEGEVIKNQ
ncbi:MAG TPA: amidohydrolase family protein [Chitinophagaceae bacterium]|nr:amidohydrolase family protein [Chitinophagaceae bacterium]